MIEISTDLIKDCVYKLCFEANTCLDESVYNKVLAAYESETEKDIRGILKNILINAKIAYQTKRPLCQDTGQVIVFLEIGQNVKLTGDFLYDAINNAVEKCYIDNYFRKSVVKNSVFDRTNTKTNTPCIIYTKYIKEEKITLKVLIKGAGSENKSKLEMMLPTANENEIIAKCSELILSAKNNACPPMFIGLGLGATCDKASVMSKEALVTECFSDEEKQLAEKIKNYVNEHAPKEYSSSYVLDAKLLTSATHIACMPVAVTINCHSERSSSCDIYTDKIIYHHKIPNFLEFSENDEDLKEINSDEIEVIRNLKQGEKILLSGEIYIARDMAHKKLTDLIYENKQLPVDYKDKIIFYAGPCPSKDNEQIGSVGPTTASRMDKYAVNFYNNGLLATIGKGERSIDVKEAINKNKAKYFTVQGGIAAFLSEKVKTSEIIAFEELGAEAIYKIKIEKLPLKVEIA